MLLLIMRQDSSSQNLSDRPTVFDAVHAALPCGPHSVSVKSHLGRVVSVVVCPSDIISSKIKIYAEFYSL